MPYIMSRLEGTYNFSNLWYVSNFQIFIAFYILIWLEGTSNYLVFK